VNTKDKYNDIIGFIEELIAEAIGEKSSSIAEQVIIKKGRGIPIRDMGALFSFMTGDALNPYIKKRQLMKAYEQLLDSDESIVDIAYNYTGSGDQSVFNKSFRRQFDMTPSEARRDKKYELLAPPQTWEVVSSDNYVEASDESRQKDDLMPELQKYGIPQTKYELIKEAMDMQAIYGFSDVQSETAFRIADKYDVDIREAFEFVDDCSIQFSVDVFERIADENTNLSNEDYIPFDGPILYTYFNFDLSVPQSLELIDELSSQGVEDVTIEDTEIIEEYIKHGLQYKYLKKLHKYYADLPNSNFEFYEFINCIVNGDSPEVAVDILSYSAEEMEKDHDKMLNQDLIESIWAEEENDVDNEIESIDKFDCYDDDLFYEPDEDERSDFHIEDREDFIDYIEKIANGDDF
jgi:AraC-like DNA-binding protein